MAHKHVLEMFRLDGRIALVTGGARGLGKTIATALAEAGADVALAGRTLATCEEAAAEIGMATKRRVKAFRADVAKSEDVTRLATDVAAQLGPIDILVNNAGNNIRGPIQELNEADWDSVLDTNLKGPFLCSRAIGPEMVERGWGRIINLGSILSVVAIPGRTPYASAKAGVTGLTRALALEWAGTGVTVNAICPGYVATDMVWNGARNIVDRTGKSFEDAVQALADMNPGRRLIEPEEVAEAVARLIDDAATNGECIVLDGTQPSPKGAR